MSQFLLVNRALVVFTVVTLSVWRTLGDNRLEHVLNIFGQLDDDGVIQTLRAW